jgi:hypothetical protein
MKVTEALLQAVVMRWCMGEKHHEYVIPNSNTFINYSSEADLISVTRAGLIHEFEMKISKADYNRDGKKRKWLWNYLGTPRYSPNYFWYVTCGFQIEPPEHAGWIEVYYDDERFYWNMRIKKQAPQLLKLKIGDGKAKVAARLLAWRVTNLYGNLYLRKKVEDE